MSETEDSEPEEIDTKTSKNVMIEEFDNQKKAVRDYIETNKNKRKQINDKYVKQKINKRNDFKSIEKLSQNILNEINFDSEEKTKTVEKPKDKQKDKPFVKKSLKKKKSFELKTRSTRFDVINVNKDLPKIIEIKAKSKKNAINFKDNMIFDKRRNKRIASSKQKSLVNKQSFNKR